MNDNAIGVFDSGLGGLTAVKELCEIMPGENIVYFGDTSRVPYGTRSRETILRYSKQDLNFLSSFNIKAALVACGTISSVALDSIKDDYDFPIIGVIDSAAAAAVSCTENGKIGVIGTPATVKSGAYETRIKQMLKDAVTLACPCPLFVPLVENGHIDPSDPLVRHAVELYLEPIVRFGADTVILGCTHYPIIARAISEYLGQGIRLVNSGREAARTLCSLLSEKDMRCGRKQGKCSYYVSDSTENFENIGGVFMCRPICGDVHNIDIEKY